MLIFCPMLPSNLAFVDIETTGLNPRLNQIIEVGVILTQNNKIVDEYQTLVNPNLHLPPEVELLTGIKAEDLEKAPLFYEIAFKIQNLLTDFVLVAHNARFDYAFLKNALLRENLKLKNDIVCTVKLSRLLFPNETRHNLDAIINRFNLPSLRRHRALTDAKTLYHFLSFLQKTCDQEQISRAFSTILQKPSLPPNLALQENLSQTTGVYIFYGENEAPLYVGKSINLKERIFSHFSASLSSPKELKISQQIRRIETIPTAGELEALLLESSLVKTLLPLYNRQLRNKKLLTALFPSDHNGYFSIKMEALDKITPQQAQESLGFFKSIKKAKEYLLFLASEKNLCAKILGLEKLNGSCFAYRLGKCFGACQGLEKKEIYNLRSLTALSANKILPWPFKGPIMIEEVNTEYGLYKRIYVDKWCLLQNTQDNFYESNGELIESTQLSYSFDLDTYKIIKRYLSSPRNLRKVKNLT